MRTATRADLDDILELENRTFPETSFTRSTFLYYMSSESSQIHVMEGDDELAGYVVFTFRGQPLRVYVDSIAVRADYRRRGLGRRMMKKVMDAARKQDAAHIRLHVRVSNRDAAEFYRALGFRKTETVSGFYRNGEDADVMERAVNAGPP